ncbi:MAG TPA: hypothetical protein ENH10_07595, partial [Bacteroidetes bacterium]|nr:hypothetical protein [Bacteroidota bacterium]HEX05002.1 hypothetical protein [Bacteroidota bacterium]
MPGTHGDQQTRRTQLSDLSNGYRASATIFSAIELGVFKALSNESKSADDLAADLDCSPRGLRILLDALTGLDLLLLDDVRYSLHGLADEFLCLGKHGYMGDILEHNVAMMKKWVHMAEVVRTDKPIQREKV